MERNNEHIAKVYDFLIKILDLSPHHKSLLSERGFSEEQMERMGYKTLPNRRTPIVDKCAQNFDLNGVPGFWCNDKGLWLLAGKSGLLVPVRNLDGSIASLKIRADDAELKGKYLQLSTNPRPDKNGDPRYPKGTEARIAVHHPIGERKGDTIRVTEGEIKADIATLLSKTYTISLPGVAMWERGLEAIDALKPKTILLAFDSDKNKEYSTSTSPASKPFEVGKALGNLYIALKEKEYKVLIEDWDEGKGKGIDDVLSAGFEDSINVMKEADAEAFVSNALQDEMQLNWIYVIGTKRFINIDNLQELDKEQYNDKFATKHKRGKPAEKAIKHPGFPKADCPIYEPGEDRILQFNDIKYFNFWQACTLSPEAGEVDIFLNHCKYMLPKKEERNILLDFLAFQVQNPGKKVHWALLLQSVQGTGKSYFGDVMRRCLGAQNVAHPSNEAIHEPYTGWQKSCQLVVIEELMARGRLELMNKLKPMITQPIAVIREMYKPPYEQPNRFNLLIFTNHEDAIIIDETDRRYCVLYSISKPQKPEYYATLWDWTEKNAGKILHWLQNRSLKNFNPHAHAPMTTSKKQLIAESEPSIYRWIRENIELSNWPFQGDLIDINHLIDCLPQHLRSTNQSVIGKALQKAGAKELKQIKLSTGSWVRLLTVRRHDMWEGENDEILATQYEKWSMHKEPGGNPLMDAKPL